MQLFSPDRTWFFFFKKKETNNRCTLRIANMYIMKCWGTSKILVFVTSFTEPSNYMFGVSQFCQYCSRACLS